MRYEGLVIVDGAVIYRTPPVFNRDVAYAWASDEAARRGHPYADIQVATR
jgi:hypothetical protein